MSRYGGLVWSLARRLLRDDGEAEDAVQEVFVDLWRNAGRFDPDRAGEATFVGMIARRRMIDRRRRTERMPAPVALGDSVEAGEPSRNLEVEDEVRRLRPHWDSLRSEDREVLELSIHGGLTHREIAERCGIPLGTVKTRTRRALRELREGMRRTGGDE